MNLQGTGTISGGVEHTRRPYLLIIGGMLLVLALGVAGAWQFSGRGASSRPQVVGQSVSTARQSPALAAAAGATAAGSTTAPAYYLVASQQQADAFQSTGALKPEDAVLVVGSPAANARMVALLNTNQTRESNHMLPLAIVDLRSAAAQSGVAGCQPQSPERPC